MILNTYVLSSLRNFKVIRTVRSLGNKEKKLMPVKHIFSRFTLLLGVIGNLLILIAILGYKKMKSSTNVFLASLAFADLLLCLICIPVKVRFQYVCAFIYFKKGQLLIFLIVKRDSKPGNLYMYYNYNKGYLILNQDPNANNISMEVCRKVGATEFTTFY